MPGFTPPTLRHKHGSKAADRRASAGPGAPPVIASSDPQDRLSLRGQMLIPAVRRMRGFALCDLAHRSASSRALLRTLPCIASDALPGNAPPAVPLDTLPGIAPAMLALDTLPGDARQARLHGVALKRKPWIVGILLILHQCMASRPLRAILTARAAFFRRVNPPKPSKTPNCAFWGGNCTLSAKQAKTRQNPPRQTVHFAAQTVQSLALASVLRRPSAQVSR